MIRKLRKKLILVLMAVVCLFLIGILISLFVTAKTEFERRSFSSFREPPAHGEDAKPGNPAMIDMPIAIGKLSAQGEVSIVQNQIYYLTDAELTTIIGNLSAQTEDSGTTSAYDLRYRRRVNDEDGDVRAVQDLLCTAHALRAERALVVKARRVDDDDGAHRQQLHRLGDGVGRRAADGGHKGDLLPGDGVDNAGLAGVAPPEKADMDAVRARRIVETHKAFLPETGFL